MEEQGGSLKVLSSLCCVVLSLHSLLGWGESYVKDPFMSITTVSCISMAWVVSYGKIQRRVARLPTSGVNTSRGAVRIRQKREDENVKMRNLLHRIQPRVY